MSANVGANVWLGEVRDINIPWSLGPGAAKRHCWDWRAVPSAKRMLRSQSFSHVLGNVMAGVFKQCVQGMVQAFVSSDSYVFFSSSSSCTCSDLTIMIMSAGGNALRSIFYNSLLLLTIHLFCGFCLLWLYELLSWLSSVYCSIFFKDGFSHVVPEDCMCGVRQPEDAWSRREMV